jgi:two-component system, NarL family, nitrate/nitrite response regulator NarL
MTDTLSSTLLDIEQPLNSERDPPKIIRSGPLRLAGDAAVPEGERRSGGLKPRLRTIIVDENAFARAGLAQMLDDIDFPVVASYASLQELESKRLGRGPCLLLKRANSVGSSMLLALSALKSKHPSLRVILLVDHCDPEARRAGMDLEIDAFLSSSEVTPEVLKKILELVLMGGVVVLRGVAGTSATDPPRLNTGLSMALANSREVLAFDSADQRVFPGERREPRLSDREKTILRFLTQGTSNKQIARDLVISEGTVKVHVKSLLRKIAARNRTQAAIWATSGVGKEMMAGD